MAESLSEINLHRPFYPYGSRGGPRKRHLFDALGVESGRDLLRRCELEHEGRDAAECLFSTLGPKQVGEAAL